MPKIKRLHYACILLSISLLSAGVISHGVEKNALVQATTEPNLRTGPGLNHPSLKVLKDGEKVVVERLEGDWYSVIAAGGLKGYLHKSVLSFSETKPAAAVEGAKPQPSESKKSKAADSSRLSSSSAPARAAAPSSKAKPSAPGNPPAAQSDSSAPAETTPSAQAPSLMQLLEGRERDMVLWFTIAAAFFLIGWICGGNYYLRRDRLRRTKLRF